MQRKEYVVHLNSIINKILLIKKLNRKKEMKITFKNALMVAVCAIGLSSFVACSDKKEPVTPPTEFLPTSENGAYAGTMKYQIEGSELSEGEAVEFKMEQSKATGVDSLVIDKFPIEGLVTAIVGPELAPGIIAAVGSVKYFSYYTATKEANDKIDLTFTPKPLVIKIDTDQIKMSITVNIKTPATGLFTVSTKKSNFSLIVENVQIDAAPADPSFKPITLNFEGTKK